ncbi:MAG: zinc ABC transporter solute-binding protein [Hyphomicrobiales bacterium]|nr:zinc ABC transporter solute-binding protein [Hyphomicrobiales bacterium]
MKRLSIVFMTAIVAGTLTAHAAPDVVVSIKPIHSLVAGVMAGVGEPVLIMDGAGSPHTYSLRPSQAADLQNADIVFQVGKQLEAFLAKPIRTVGANAKVIALIDSPGLSTLPFRHADDFAGVAHQDVDRDEEATAGNLDERDHDHGSIDPHIWLDPQNAKALVSEIQRILTETDPDNAENYATNAAALKIRLDQLIADVEVALAPVAGRSFVAFHDAYRYFENRFGVHAAGTVTVSPEVMPGAARLAEIRERIGALSTTCVFAEPQFTPKLVTIVTEGSAAMAGVLDPLGTTLEAGPDHYFKLIEAMAQAMRDCLSTR